VDELDRFVRDRVAQTAAGLDREQTPQAVARDKAWTVVRLR
jgi:ribosomal protein S30